MKKCIFYFLAFFLYGLHASAQGFMLNTTKTIWHAPATGSNHKALIKENHSASPILYETTKKEFEYDKEHPYCRKNRRAIDLIKDENTYSYVRWRGGLFLKYHDCKTGDHATFKARTRRIHLEYKKTF